MASPADHHHRIDVGHPAPIFRVPYPFRHSVELMFIPHVVSIGPVHHVNPNFGGRCPPAGGLQSSSFGRGQRTPDSSVNLLSLAEMENYKQHAKEAINMGDDSTFDRLVVSLKNREDEMVGFYDKTLMQDYHNVEGTAASTLANLVALDACFIACILRCLYEDSVCCPHDEPPSPFLPVYREKLSRPVRKAILQDFLLVENQIPLFAVREAIRADKKCPSDSNEASVEGRLALYLAAMALRVLPFSKSGGNLPRSVKQASKNGAHLLDCMYSIIVFEENQKSSDVGSCKHQLDPQGDKKHRNYIAAVENYLKCQSIELASQQGVPGAKELYLSGVTIHGHDNTLMELSFHKGKLSIPKIYVGDDTEKIFRNLLAYESCYKVHRVDILSYVHFMDFLVDTPQDVGILIKHKVIVESIGSSEKVAEMWNRLCRNTSCVFSPKYSHVSKLATDYCNSPLKGMWAEFYRSNLSRPWLVVPVISATALLVMTFVIMWFTLLLYSHEMTTHHME